MKPTGPTNPILIGLIEDLKKKSLDQKTYSLESQNLGLPGSVSFQSHLGTHLDELDKALLFLFDFPWFFLDSESNLSFSDFALSQ